jgi:hypothetical protein
MRLKVSIFLLCIASVSTPLTARLVRPWTYQEIFDKSDLVVIATFVSTRDTEERNILRDLTPPVKVVGVTTEFETRLVLKGPKNVSRFQVHHFRFENPLEATWVDAPQLIRLPTAPQDGVHYAGHETFLMFLRKEPDGRYAPTTGQTDPATLAVRDLTCGG